MYLCEYCGGKVTFDIKTQQIYCPFCGATKNPKDFEINDKTSAKEKIYMTNLFQCPHCGGEIISEDEEFTGYCPFCATYTTLQGRVSKENKPHYIIPFKISKEECKNIFMKYVKGTKYAPKYLLDESCFDKFRAIYMPYWIYSTSQNSPISIVGEISHNDDPSDYYEITGYAKGVCNGLSFDSSSNFEDDISESIMPYETKDIKIFSPAYLIGFCANRCDVPPTVYCEELLDKINTRNIEELNNIPQIKNSNIKSLSISNLTENIPTKIDKIESILYPVWFLSYRTKDDRILYATINGQTGKMAMDIPISLSKYLLSSCIFTIPIFLLFLILFFVFRNETNLFFNIMSYTIIMLSNLTMIFHSTQLYNIMDKQKKINDKGALFKKSNNPFVKKEDTHGISVFAALGILFVVMLCSFEPLLFESELVGVFFYFATVVVQWFALIKMFIDRKKIKEKFSLLTDTFMCIANVIVFLFTLTNEPILRIMPLSLLCFTNILVFFPLISKYNEYCTRILPQFKQKNK